MIPMQFCRKLEAYYGRDMNPELTEEMLRYLRRFPQESLEKIYRRTLEMCLFLPNVAHVRKASEDFLVRTPGKTKTRQGCPQCQYTTWVLVTLHHPLKKGETYEAVKACKCTLRKIKPAASASPGGRGGGAVLSKHTPGPWGPMASLSDDETIAWTPIQGKLEAAPGLTIGSPHHPEPICRVSGYLQPVVANARLIAAAPEMLEALEQTRKALKYCQKHVSHKHALVVDTVCGLALALGLARIMQEP